MIHPRSFLRHSFCAPLIGAVSVTCMIVSLLYSLHWLILFPVLIFAAYDGYFCRNEDFQGGRNLRQTLEGIRAANNYISYIIAFIGLFSGIVFSRNENLAILNVLKKDVWLLGYAFSIVALSGVVMLFIPVKYIERGTLNEEADVENARPSAALRVYYCMVIFLEKVIVLFLIYLLLVILRIWIR